MTKRFLMNDLLSRLAVFGLAVGCLWQGLPAAAAVVDVANPLAALTVGQSDSRLQTPSARYLPRLLGSGDQTEGRRVDPFQSARGNTVMDSLDNNSPQSADKARAKGLIDKSRAALVAGNLIAAEGWYHKAASMNVAFGPSEDSPARLAADLRRAGVDPRRLVPASTGDRFDASPDRIRPDMADRLVDRGQRLPEPSFNNRPIDNPYDAARSEVLPASFEGRGDRFAAAPRGNNLGQPAGPPNDLRFRDQNENRPAALPPMDGPITRLPGANSAPSHPNKDKAVGLLAEARAALSRGDLDRAERLAQTAKSLNVPDSAFHGGDERPWMVLIDIERARGRQPSGAAPAGSLPPRGDLGGRFNVRPSLYEPGRDGSRVVPAQAETDTPDLEVTPPSPFNRNNQAQGGNGEALVRQGEDALQERELEKALDLFKQAWKFENELSPQTRGRLRGYLQDLQVRSAQPQQGDATPIDEVEAQQRVMIQQMFSDVSRELRLADQMVEKDPKGAMERLMQLRGDVENSNVREAVERQQLVRIDRKIAELETFIEANRPLIEQEERNRAVRAAVENDRAVRIEVQEKLAELVDEFNNLMDEHQFAQAEAVARQAQELAPQEPVVQTLLWKSRFVRRLQSQMAIRDEAEDNYLRALENVDRSGIPFDDNNPLQYPDVRYWEELTASRRKHSGKDNRKITESEVAIYNALKKPVDVRFNERPLSEVIYTLGAAAGVNVHIDGQGLAAEGLTSDQPVTMNLQNPISLRSALKHILGQFRLNYVVQDEVLKVTSEQMRESHVFSSVYNVADLVIPIPNFTPSYNIGLAGALRQAHADLGYGWQGGRVNSGPLQVASAEGPQSINPLALTQVGGMGNGRGAQPIGFGPGGVQGGAQPDFDSLIDLLTTTVSPSSWDEVGGPGSVVGFETNLSLVISQTQEVHDEIVDLLEQLRRLQDLQVTIEVRFITLNDNFFERIGVDFDFDIDDNVTALPGDDSGQSVTIGLDPTGMPTADFDLSFNQGSFGAAVPTFGGFDPGSAANFGFAILSDIEAFFVIQAAQGDSRTNVMQAPKVTLFNGQQAFVSDTSQTPFVTSVIPVVGDFAAAHQPVIVVLTEGTSLSVQAVVSNDRRYVRLTVVPFFSQIGEVDTFTFNGKRTSSTSSQTSVDPDDDGDTTSQSDTANDIIEGTTVQLPTFSFVTVTTTVSVPDGGTVLLGGVKRLSEGRTEAGVPIMNKLPYINRLFKNVGIGRETQSLMMMVTPRIIIQEEEEEKLGIGGFGTGSP